MASRSGGGTVLASGIRTREKKERKLYSDDWALGDEEIEGHHTFNLDEKISTERFNMNFVKDMTELEFNVAYVQKNGFNWPLLFKKKSQLGIVVPPSDFNINDVRLCVGSRRMLDVMDVNTQKNVEMTMKDWQRYYESEDKDKLLNVISLEFSHTRMETIVEAPVVVRQIDWVEKVWPRHLKEAQSESTNVLEDMMYPKVQKYCLMSVAGCYTDFHIDFGGTSVWYHILRGKKIFWLIPPSERNIQLYEQWVLSGKQSDIFFGDTVEKCARVELYAGDTFFIPTGWIHAVYTPDDSLVFGGNFLHSFGIEKQLRVAHVEDTTHVPQKFRYPFFTEMLWYVLERYVNVLLGRTHLLLPPEEQDKYERAVKPEENSEKEHTHLTQYELHGLKAIVMYLHSLPTSKKFVPELIKDPIALIRDVRTVVEQHRYDSPELAVTNVPVLEWWTREPVKFNIKRPISDAPTHVKKRRQSSDEPKSVVVRAPPNAARARHRRVRCKECEPCLRGDCRKCVFCKDMTKYGGPGTMKQTCKLKKCSQPCLPALVTCYICQLDGWDRAISGTGLKPPSGVTTSLMECCICFKIAHIPCAEMKFSGIEGIVNEDLTNSWECPECIKLGYNKEYKHNRVSSSRFSSGGSDTNIKSPLGMSEAEDVDRKVKLEPLSEGNLVLSEDAKVTPNGPVKSEKIDNSDPSSPQMPTWDQLQARVSYPLVRPSWIVRPAPPAPEVHEEDDDGSGRGDKSAAKRVPRPPVMIKAVMVKIFSLLSRKDLLNAMRVCRQWAEWATDPSLWKYISLAHCKIDVNHLHGIVRRQPNTLRLDWSRISYEQFSWLIPRLPQMDGLHCEGLSWEVLRPLVSPYCPPLTRLNLSFCEGVDNDTLSQLLRPPPFHRPGHRDTITRLRHLKHLQIAGTQVGDAGVAVIARSLPALTNLDLSGCLWITEHAVELLANPSSLIAHSLTHLDLRGCHRMSPLVLPALACFPRLCNLALDPCKYIPLKAIRVWGQSHSFQFDSEERMTRPPPLVRSDDDDDMVADEGTFPVSVTDTEVQPTKHKAGNLELRKIGKTDEDKENADGNTMLRPGMKNPAVLLKTLSQEKGAHLSEKMIVKPSIPLPKSANDETKDNESGNRPKPSSISSDKKAVVERQAKKEFLSAPVSERKVVVKETGSTERMGKEKPPSECDPKRNNTSDDDLNNISTDSLRNLEPEIGSAQSPAEGVSSESCRRSERSNKGSKYKLSIAEKRSRENKIDQEEGSEEITLQKDDDSEVEEKPKPPKKKRLLKKNSPPSVFKRRVKKNIMTRSKKLRTDNPKSSDNESERVCLKRLKEEKTLPKAGRVEGRLKLHLSVSKGVQKYVSKLRKKSHDGDGTSLISKTKTQLRSPKDEEKSPKRKQEESISKKTKNQSDEPSSKRESPSSSLPVKKRKERKGSSSSSSSSSHSPSFAAVLATNKKLKIELEPIGKFNRRRSDGQKIGPSFSGPGQKVPLGTSSPVSKTPSTASVSSTSSASPSSTAVATPTGDKGPSRERPERQHRSPRRLSMCH